MIKSIRAKFGLVVAMMLALALLSYAEVAYFTGQLSASIDRAEQSERIAHHGHAMLLGLWEARFWEKTLLLAPTMEGEQRFQALMEGIKGNAQALSTPETAAVLSPGDWRRLGNVLSMAEGYELAFQYMLFLRHRQLVHQANALFSLQDLLDPILAGKDPPLVRLALEVSQARLHYMTQHEPHQYQALGEALKALEAAVQAAGPPERFQNKLGLVRFNLERDFALEQETRLITRRFDEITGELGGAIHDLSAAALEFSRIQHQESALLRERLPRVFLASGVGGTLILLGLLAFIAYTIIRPVRELAEAARRVEGGERTARAKARGRDEIGRLGRSFNAMLDALEESNQRLIAYQSGLENLVAERTRELAASEGKFRGLVESARDALVLIDAQGRLDLLNPVGSALTGYSPWQARSLLFRDLVHPDDWKGLKRLRAWFVSRPSEASLVSPPVEFRLRRRDGAWLEVEATFSPLTPGGREEYMGVLRDVSERKKAEKVLKESEERYRWLIERAGVGRFVADAQDLRFLFVNRTLCDMFGIPGEKGLALTMPDVLAPGEHERMRRKLRERREGRRMEPLVRYQVVRADGSTFLAEIMLNLVEYEGRPAVQGVLRDATEEQRREEQRTRMQKLEALGTLAGGVAHDFNNILAGILGNLNLARVLAERRQDWTRAITAAETAAQRAAQMTSQLLTFAKGGEPALEAVELPGLLQEAAAMALGAGAQVAHEIICEPGLGAVKADRSQVLQVMTNLLINARQAMPRGGTVFIRAENARLDKDQAVGLLPAGAYVKVSVADQGVGIGARDLERIFDPFFTTKTQGTGLGLATSHSIISRHRGHIEVASSVGQGSVFTFYLPATAERPATAVPAQEELTSGSGRVLIVDDEEPIREMMAEALTMAGYQVEALDRFGPAIARHVQARGEGRPFDLVIFDLTVPGDMSGAEALQELRARDPLVKAVVASGYSDRDLLAQPAKYGFAAAIRKPFTLAHLTRVVAEVLAGAPEPGGFLGEDPAGD